MLALSGVSPYLKAAYFAVVIGTVICGILTLALQSCTHTVWSHCRDKVSLFLNGVGTLLFIVSLQSYAAILLFTFLVIKVILLTKKH